MSQAKFTPLQDVDRTPTYFNLGSYSCPVTTDSHIAQGWFDRGLAWIYGYNHEEAVICFENGLKADPNLVMAHWGIAYAVGPNYNRWWETFSKEDKRSALSRAHQELQAANRLKYALTDVEIALIEALQTRYPTNPGVDDISPWSDAYGNAMRAVYKRYPNNLEVSTLFAEALMNRTPWKLWDLKTGGVPEGADTKEVIDALERAFAEVPGAWDHAGLLHLYIHVMEMSPHPERALRHGDRLAQLMPDSGHLWHMPTHIDVLCGHYQTVIERNSRAIEADRKFLALRGADNFYSYYRSHN